MYPLHSLLLARLDTNSSYRWNRYVNYCWREAIFHFCLVLKHLLLANYLGISEDKKRLKEALVSSCSEIMLPKWKIKMSVINICDPPYDLDAKGDRTLTTHLYFTTKEIGFSTLNVCPGAHFISKLFCFIRHTWNNRAWPFKQRSVSSWTKKHVSIWKQNIVTQHTTCACTYSKCAY